MILLKEVILLVIQYICIAGLMIVFIMKSILPAHVSSFVSRTIYDCIKATMDLPSRIQPKRDERCIVDDTIPPVHIRDIRSLFPPTIYACDQNTIKATMDLPSPIKPRRDERCIVDDTIDLTPVKSKTLVLIDAKYRMRLQRTCRRQLFK